ncbi:DUF4192 domain-containing protein [Pseudonocardia hispaniensis]|uniref:DUF4192 domain-containing protein n=1 Tax=Pseudonocardia hispaniensis TaxID=904933 RepID=A0ABW1J2T6_9PSEU
MTSIGVPDHPSTRPGRPAQTTARVRDPGELVAAVPVLLGFHPRDSLVVIGIGGSGVGSGLRLGLTLRVDLPPPTDTVPVCRAAAATLSASHPVGAVAIVLGGSAGEGAPRPDVAAAISEGLESAGIVMHGMIWARDTAAGAPWMCYPPCGCSGEIPDPAATAVAAAAVAAGHVVYADRAELERQVTPADTQRLRRRDVLLDRVLGTTAAADDQDDAPHHVTVDTALSAAEAGRLELDDAVVVALAAALQIPAVRDRALAECVGHRAAAAEQLWAALTRELPDPEAADAATLLAVAALGRGDGALANVALTRAQQAWPGHRLSAVLGKAVATGFGPAQVRRWLGADR